MKKIIIAAAIALAGMFANAATVNWNTSYLYDSAGNYIMMHTGEEGLSYTASLLFAPSGSASVSEAYGQFTGSGSDFALGTEYTATLIITEMKNGKANATLTASGVFTTAASESFTTDIDFSTGGGFTSGKFFGDGAGQWAAVPEPTSGLLMLVGLAGLALRRRRA